MDFTACFEKNPVLLMEGALGERLKREYHLHPDENVALAGIVYQDGGRQALFELWNQYLKIAEKYHLPFLATTPTRRANKERVFRAGLDEKIIFDNAALLKQIKQTAKTEMYIGGLMGCRGDAYQANEALPADAAEEFHFWQANLLRQSGVDFLFAGIMPALTEAIGMARAMERTGLPYIISFMIRKNGRLIDGTAIHDAIFEIDRNVTRKPVCYMTNCVHPDVLYEALSCKCNGTPLVRQRFLGIQANTSALSPEELDGSAELLCSGCMELSQSMARLKNVMNLKIAGGCCGTDDAHMEEVARLLSNSI